jgi:ketosteroid isomerase-like protein
VNPDYAMEGGVREGLASLREGLRNLHDQFDYHSLEIQEMIEGEAGVLVIARLRASGRSSRVPIDEVFSHVFRIHDGRVVSYEWFRTREEGLAALATEPLGG